jgi:UDP-glucose 4-epimerase
MAEDICLSYSRNFEIPVAIVRLFSVYGIGLCKQLLWDACNKLSLGPSTFGGTGEETRDWLHVEDAARLLLSVGISNTSGRFIFNGGTGVGVSTREIVEPIAKAFGGADRAKFTGKRRLGDPIDLVACMDHDNALTWQPEKSLDIELQLYINWFIKEVL